MKKDLSTKLIILIFIVISSCSYNSGFQFIENPKDCFVTIDTSSKLIIEDWSKNNNLEIDWTNSSVINHDFLRCEDSVNFWVNEIRFTFQRLINLIDSHSIANNYSLEFNYNVYYYRDSLINFTKREDLNKLNMKDFENQFLGLFGIIGSSYNDQLMEKEELPIGYNYVHEQFKEMEKYILDVLYRYNNLLMSKYNVLREDLGAFDKENYDYKKIIYYVIVNKNKSMGNPIVIKLVQGKVYKVK